MSLRGLDNDVMPITSILAPSLQQTFSHCQMQRVLYLGIDEDEEIDEKKLDEIRVRFERRLRIDVASILRFPAHWRNFGGNGVIFMYNALYERAMMDGCDFAVSLSDDTRMETPMWDRILGSFLCLNQYVVGAYSTQDRYEPSRMSNIMVSRTHYDIFGFFCNPFSNDMTSWFLGVLAHCTKVMSKAKSTNVIRETRRQRNGTFHPVVRCDAEIIEQDKKHFSKIYLSRSL